MCFSTFNLHGPQRPNLEVTIVEIVSDRRHRNRNTKLENRRFITPTRMNQDSRLFVKLPQMSLLPDSTLPTRYTEGRIRRTDPEHFRRSRRVSHH